ncbi:MAG TPA: glycosyltransferase [Pseudomonadales bacterium]|nr:glycosyltransferase [Pseudomonadales bacterium]
MPKVSVVMPAYNAEKFLQHAIDSVLSSTLQDLELIVVNDGSTDKTAEILQTNAIKDARVKVITQANSGRPAIPKNVGLQQAAGDYVCFLDSDDYIAPDKLALMTAALDKFPQWCAVFHDLKLVDATGKELGSSYLHNANFLLKAASYLQPLNDDWYDCGDNFYIFQSLYYAAFHTQSVMLAKQRLPWDQIQFDTQFIYCEDTDLWIRIGMMGRIGYLDKVLSYYRQHDANITLKKQIFAEDTVLIHEHNFKRIISRLNAEQQQQYRQKIADCYRELAYLYSNNKQGHLARKTYVKAARWAQPEKVLLPFLKTFAKDFLSWLKSA